MNRKDRMKNHKGNAPVPNKGTKIPLPISKEQLVQAMVSTANKAEIKKKQKGFLCMFSGGLDSTAMLNSLLTNKDYEDFNVYVHHVRIINRENRDAAELNAVRSIVKYYHDRKDIRQFDYKESVFDTSSMHGTWSNSFSMDLDVLCFMAAQICIAKPVIKYVGIGVTKDEIDEGGEQHHRRITSVPKIFEAALYRFPDQIPRPTIIYPVQKATKLQLWNSLPPKLQEMTWSCRKPNYVDDKPQKCGECHTCLMHKKAGIDS